MFSKLKRIDKSTNKTDEEKILQGGSEDDVRAKGKPVFKVKPRKIVFGNFEKNVQYEVSEVGLYFQV